MGKGKPVTEEEIAITRARHAAGEWLSVIAKDLKRPYSSLARFVPKGSHRDRSPVYAEAAAAYVAGKSWVEVMKEFAVEKQTFLNYLNDHNIPVHYGRGGKRINTIPGKKWCPSHKAYEDLAAFGRGARRCKLCNNEQHRIAYVSKRATNAQIVTNGEKLCSKCLRVLAIERFSKCPNVSSGLQSQCRDCTNARYKSDKVKQPKLESCLL